MISTVAKSSLTKIDETQIINDKIPAGCLLEAVGAKGFKSGQLSVALFYTNVILNSGHGNCRQVLKLSKLLSARVKRRFGILLEPEVRFLK